MKYVIHACEQSYGGLHGIETCLVVEADDYSDVVDAACEASRELMGFYCGVDEYDEEDEDLERAYEDAVEENIDYSIWRVNEDCPYNRNEIDQMIANDLEDFVEEFCIFVE